MHFVPRQILVVFNCRQGACGRGFIGSGLIAGVMLLISGCDAAYDCIDDDGPVFDKSVLTNPVLNQVYQEAIRASIENEPGDDRFDYEFTLTGNLPEMLEYSQSNRDFIISGTPIESGTYAFELRVHVDDGLSASDSGLCRTSLTRSFQFTVQAM